MNIFYTDKSPVICAKNLMNRHCIKMPTESAQILSSCHRILDGSVYIDKSSKRSIKRWKLDDNRENILYKASHISHPSVIWTKINDSNYFWHFDFFIAMLNEYQYRYNKVHACSKLIPYLKHLPNNMSIGDFTEPTPAMPKECIIHNDSIASYRNYYITHKRHLAEWKSRDKPYWYK